MTDFKNKTTFCTDCTLQFGTLSVFKMHLSLVHKEQSGKKEESAVSKKVTESKICFNFVLPKAYSEH